MEDSLIQLDKVEHIFLTEVFEKSCPYYMAIGMSYEQFWRDDATIAISFRKMHKIKQEQLEWNIWKGGMYTYEALCKVSPVLHAFAKSNTKPLPFSEKPYGIEKLQEKETNTESEKQKIENERLKAQIFFNSWFKSTEKHFKKESG